ncbi:type II secretion system protein [Roseateles sp. LYH14W]|uniref:type II secretion system protein n=1 Tax=Pelomonas parva TaxID=3299032 RepID=UPI00374839D0
MGYTFVAVLIMLTLCALGMAAAGPLWADAVQRDREQELLRIGALYAAAITEYRDSSPGNHKQLPLSLDELVSDPRFISTMRHLRKLYPDPLDPARPWGLVLDTDGRVMGVYSQSQDAPLAQGPQRIGALQLPPAQRYADWKFTLVNTSR